MDEININQTVVKEQGININPSENITIDVSQEVVSIDKKVEIYSLKLEETPDVALNLNQTPETVLNFDGVIVNIDANYPQALEAARIATEKAEEATQIVEGFDEHALEKEADFDNNATSKTTAFNQNATSKTDGFNTNASNKTSDFNENASSKTSDFNDNYTDKLGDFNSNATNKTTAFNNNASDKTTAFNNNATAKTGDFNDNATSKTNDFNTNATNKTNDFNSNYTEKKGLIDAEVLVAQGAAGEAKQWAIGDPSEPTGNSAKYWAEQASHSIPNDGQLDIQVNGSSVATFTANQSGNTTANIVVPDSATWGNITGTLSNQTDLQDALNGKQDTLTAGTDLEIISGSGAILPDTYEELEYIQSDGACYIDTGIISNGTDTIEQKFQKIGTNTTTCSWFGSMEGNNLLRFSIGSYYKSSVSKSVFMGGYNFTQQLGDMDTNAHVVKFYCISNTYYDVFDGVPATYQPVNEGSNPTINSWIFARHGADGANTIYDNEGTRIFYHKQKRFNGTAILDLVPARRIADGELGFYNLVNNTFLTNSGSGTLTGGNVVTHSNNTVIKFTNDTGYITGITSSDVVNALGYTPETLPSQTGQSGKYLTTDGTNPSWGTPTASVASDNKSITKNSSNEIQTVGVIDQNNTSSAIKTWTGTRAQYNAIATKDATTLYTITDDTDVTLSVIEALYPVGSIYITTANSCPLANIISGSTWVLVSAGMVLQGADGNHAAGTTISAGLPNITGSVLFDSNSTNQFIPTDAFNGCLYGTNTATKSNYLSTATTGGTSKERARQLNVDASRSNPIYGNSNTVQPPAFAVNIYRRTA